jgi:hypothetical protein
MNKSPEEQITTQLNNLISTLKLHIEQPLAKHLISTNFIINNSYILKTTIPKEQIINSIHTQFPIYITKDMTVAEIILSYLLSKTHTQELINLLENLKDTIIIKTLNLQQMIDDYMEVYQSYKKQ